MLAPARRVPAGQSRRRTWFNCHWVTERLRFACLTRLQNHTTIDADRRGYSPHQDFRITSAKATSAAAPRISVIGPPELPGNPPIDASERDGEACGVPAAATVAPPGQPWPDTSPVFPFASAAAYTSGRVNWSCCQ